MTINDDRVANPIPVTITNWAYPEPAKPPYVKNTTLQTYIIPATNTLAAPGYQQVCDYEPKRYRLVIQPIDGAVALTTESPVTSPDTSTATAKPQGAYLAALANQPGYEFFGPDAFWINSLGTATRVTVIKEYC